jgi:hypothetical protein
MKCVAVESPFAGNVEQNIDYARRCVLDCIKRGEAPFASHLLYTQEGILKDTLFLERQKGINAGLKISERMDATVVYLDLGISDGMLLGIANAERHGRPVEFRRLGSIVKQEQPCALEELDLWMADWSVDTTERGWLMRWAARRARNVFGFLADAMIEIASLSHVNGDTLNSARFLAQQALRTGAIEGEQDADH